VYNFKIANGKNGTMTIAHDMLEDEAAATERAEAEFIMNSYNATECSFTTYLTDFYLGEIISVRGLPYKVISIGYEGDDNKIICAIGGERYEN